MTGIMDRITMTGIRVIVDADGNILSETVMLMSDGATVGERTARGYSDYVSDRMSQKSSISKH